MNERWNSMSLAQRRLAATVVAVAALVVLSVTLGALGSRPGGRALSSYATDDDGLAAYETLLARSEHPTSRVRVPIDRARVSPGVTLVAFGQSFSASERVAIRRFVTGGGRLLVGGPEAQDALAAVGGTNDVWDSGSEGEFEPRVTAIVRHLGSGEVIALTDPAPLTNRWLDVGDNAFLGVALAGPPGTAVVFAEYGHGYGVRQGLAGLPARWKAALWFAAIAALVGALAAGKRFGPADPIPEQGAPPRVRYVEALAATLARSRDRGAATEPLRARASRRAATRGALLTDADREALRAPPTTDDEVLALGRVAAKLEEM